MATQVPFPLSVVIPCYNSAAVIGRQLQALAPQLGPGDEVVVANNRSTDDLQAALDAARSQFATGALREVPAHGRQGINHARNSGIEHARNSSVLLCDADDVVSAGWLEAYREAFSQGADAAGGPLRRVTPEWTGIDSVRGVHSYFWPTRGIYIATATGANCGFTKAAFEALGGFDENLAGGSDEIDFFYRLSLHGLHVTWVPEANVDYVQRGTWRQIWKQQVSYGVGAVTLHRKLGPEGMPRDEWWKPLATVGFAAAQMVAGNQATKRVGLERVARRAGRAWGSLKQRHLYL